MNDKKLWIVFCEDPDHPEGADRFIAAFSDQEQAEKNANRLNKLHPPVRYFVREDSLDKDYKVYGMTKYKVTIIVQSEEDPSTLMDEVEWTVKNSLDNVCLDPDAEEEGTAITVEEIE